MLSNGKPDNVDHIICAIDYKVDSDVFALLLQKYTTQETMSNNIYIRPQCVTLTLQSK